MAAAVNDIWRDGRTLVSKTAQQQDRVGAAKRLLRRVGYEPLHWSRVEPYRICREKILDMEPSALDVLEISAGPVWCDMPFRSYRTMDYPDYDICADVLDESFDLIIADNVFEHLPYPLRAARHVRAMMRPGACFMNLTPFLVRIHEVPLDCTRWSETGMKYFLEEAGFDPDLIETGSWGNPACVKANLKTFKRKGWFGSLRNNPQTPVQVWAFARTASARRVADATETITTSSSESSEHHG